MTGIIFDTKLLALISRKSTWSYFGHVCVNIFVSCTIVALNHVKIKDVCNVCNRIFCKFHRSEWLPFNFVLTFLFNYLYILLFFIFRFPIIFFISLFLLFLPHSPRSNQCFGQKNTTKLEQMLEVYKKHFWLLLKVLCLDAFHASHLHMSRQNFNQFFCWLLTQQFQSTTRLMKPAEEKAKMSSEVVNLTTIFDVVEQKPLRQIETVQMDQSVKMMKSILVLGSADRWVLNKSHRLYDDLSSTLFFILDETYLLPQLNTSARKREKRAVPKTIQTPSQQDVLAFFSRQTEKFELQSNKTWQSQWATKMETKWAFICNALWRYRPRWKKGKALDRERPVWSHIFSMNENWEGFYLLRLKSMSSLLLSSRSVYPTCSSSSWRSSQSLGLFWSGLLCVADHVAFTARIIDQCSLPKFLQHSPSRQQTCDFLELNAL